MNQAVVQTDEGNAQSVALRMRVARTCRHDGPAGPPPTVSVTDEQPVLRPSGHRFEALDFETKLISGYCDGWSYIARVEADYIPDEDNSGGRLVMTATIESATWVGPQSVAHPIVGAFDLVFCDEIRVIWASLD